MNKIEVKNTLNISINIFRFNDKMQVTNTHAFTSGDIIAFQGRDIPNCDPLRPSTQDSYPAQSTFVDGNGMVFVQCYRVTKVLMGGDETIPERRYTSPSQLGPVPNGGVQMLTVTPLEHDTLDSYTSPKWFVNVTHMAICQYVDAMPFQFIDKLYKFDTSEPQLGDFFHHNHGNPPIRRNKPRVLAKQNPGDTYTLNIPPSMYERLTPLIEDFQYRWGVTINVPKIGDSPVTIMGYPSPVTEAVNELTIELGFVVVASPRT